MFITHKVSTWNIEWLGNLLRDIDDMRKSVAHRLRLQRRLEGIYQAITEISPDILCITEGPSGEDAIDKFTSGLPGYSTVKRAPGEPYHQRGQQWIWFIIRDHLAPEASLLPIKVWHEYTEAASPEREHKVRWPIHRWGVIDTSAHSHYRHPQVLVIILAGIRVELIGGHFKSKLTKMGNFSSADPETRRAYIETTIENRIKLGTEAQNVRYYIDQRFRQEPSPAIMLLGDLNDGPGKELFERQFMFFDLLNNLQGDVFEAEKFLNHALFDHPDHLRWTVYFRDRIEPNRDPHILLDHIMFTQALVRDQIPLRIRRHAGKVEHEIFDRINALLPSGIRLSDHKPVSCIVTESVSSERPL
jgi:hypothetical protein